MPTSFSKETKPVTSFTKEVKPGNPTFASYTWNTITGTWEDAPWTWDNAGSGAPATVYTKETKP